MASEKMYKNDFEGIYLMKSLAPESYENTDIHHLKKVIDIATRRIFKDNVRLFNKVGFNEDDLHSIFSFYAVIFINTDTPQDIGLFSSFLKQRSIRLIESFKSRAESILEDTTVEGVTELENMTINITNAYDNPEEILMAKEFLHKVIAVTGSKFRILGKEYAEKFISRNQELLTKNDIQPTTLLQMAADHALEYSTTLLIRDSKADIQEFKRLMTFKFSKFINSLR